MQENRHYLSPLFDPAEVVVVSEADPGRDAWFCQLVEGLREAFGEAPVHRLPYPSEEGRREVEGASATRRAEVARGTLVPAPRSAGRGGRLAVIRAAARGRGAASREPGAAPGATTSVVRGGGCAEGPTAPRRAPGRGVGVGGVDPPAAASVRPPRGRNARPVGPRPKGG